MNQNQSLENLNSRVKSVWQRSQRLHVTAGLLSFCRWGIMMFVVAVLLDWLIDLPAPARVVLLLVILAVALYQAWCSGWRKVRRFDAARAAAQIEDHHGNFESLLVTAVEFRQSKMAPGTSEDLQEVTCRLAEEAVVTVQPEKVVHYQGLRRPLTIALVLALIIAAFGVFNGPFLSAGIARIFPPWASIDYPTRTQLEVDTRKIIVKEGTPAVIKALVSGVIPDEAKLELRTGDGEPRVHELEITDGQCEYTIKTAYRGFEYRFKAGDAKSRWQEVEVISAPRIKQAKLKLDYPAYTKLPTETVEALTVTVPEGTHIEWKLSLDHAVSQATYTPAGGKPKPLDISEDGYSVTMSAAATESRSYSFSWVEKDHGFSFNSSNHYLQVAPDEAPRVELTSPGKNLYATLGRKLDLAFRGRDDHGIGEAHITYRVNKIEEQKVAITSLDTKDGGAQNIDWDYRKALPDLAIGDAVSFVVELTDSYPGAEGPHRARSQARRITFLSEEDYLKQIVKQKQRLLRKLRTLYREERKVHATVSKLDPTAAEFVQSCQLEAVRQDLIRERIGALKLGIKDLLDDLKANNIEREGITSILVRLHTDLQMIADEHVGLAATNLRKLAAAVQKDPKSDSANSTVAINSVDSAARELGCLVLQIGFLEATEVMARELHAIAESQAMMRLRTILLDESAGSDADALAKSQEQLSQWVTRLFGALPQDKESTISDALVAFNLSRLIKGLREEGVETKMEDTAALIRNFKTDKAAESSEAAVLQAKVIASVLYAEFRLRLGAEYEALDNANDLFTSQVTAQKKLRETMGDLTPDQFKQRGSEFAQSQAALQQKLHLLLMPAIPARRPQLLDVNLPSPPPVEDLLAAAENAMKKAAVHITAGDLDQAVSAQQQSEKSFVALSEIINHRIQVLHERARLAMFGMEIDNNAAAITEFDERQLNLIEKTENAKNDSQIAHVGRLQEKLAQDITKFRHKVEKGNKKQPSDDMLPLLNYLSRLENSMNKAAATLKAKKPDDALGHQEATLEILENITNQLADQALQSSHLASSMNDTWLAKRPGPYVSDIEAEQRDLVASTAKAKPAELPQLAIVQKNLIHAVNAVLGALDPISHHVESGTVFLFAKDDMDSAATAIVDNDMEEAADAGSFVAESLQKLSNELASVSPRYSYMLEISEFYSQAVTQNNLLHIQQNQLRIKAHTAKDAAALNALVNTQTSLQTQTKSYASQMLKGSGLKNDSTSADAMTTALNELKAGNKEAAVKQMQLVETTLTAEHKQMIYLMELLANVLKPSPDPDEVSAESLLVLEMLSVVSDLKVLYRKTQAAQAAQAKPDKSIAAKQAKLAQRVNQLIKRAESYAPTGTAAKLAGLEGEELSDKQSYLQEFFKTNHERMAQASKSISEAAQHLQSGATKDAIAQQQQAGEKLRYVLIAFINEFIAPPVPPGPQDPSVQPPGDPSMVDDMWMYMPGAVSGNKPKGGRQEWEVLGQRDRAALNENFARELPLEYRAVLKDYYERLAK